MPSKQRNKQKKTHYKPEESIGKIIRLEQERTSNHLIANVHWKVPLVEVHAALKQKAFVRSPTFGFFNKCSVAIGIKAWPNMSIYLQSFTAGSYSVRFYYVDQNHTKHYIDCVQNIFLNQREIWSCEKSEIKNCMKLCGLNVGCEVCFEIIKEEKGTVTLNIPVPIFSRKNKWKFSGQMIQITSLLSDQVSLLKGKIQVVTGIPTGIQILKMDSQTLKDFETLAHYNITTGTTISLQHSGYKQYKKCKNISGEISKLREDLVELRNKNISLPLSKELFELRKEIAKYTKFGKLYMDTMLPY